ncbi:hypothetical protein AVEN_237677-1 [Araneus ventricosus]|uniref:Uncharacterized protein n=1 Tax=Araneus ventricosus TaxID=182803 RepID=A0A4Y2QBT1_ARAVE|nr:hypothetical protein AVEN_237677-1 [Araneus ventricosus]
MSSRDGGVVLRYYKIIWWYTGGHLEDLRMRSYLISTQTQLIISSSVTQTPRNSSVATPTASSPALPSLQGSIMVVRLVNSPIADDGTYLHRRNLCMHCL